jgi:hypothetical protein
MSNEVKSRNLWRRGDKLLTLSRQAREHGHDELADDILDRAVQLLEEARVLDARPETGVEPLAPAISLVPAGCSDQTSPAPPLSDTSAAVLEDA